MVRLLKIEFRKLLNSRAFVMIGSLYVMVVFLILVGLGNFQLTQNVNGQEVTLNFGKMGVYDFPYIWQNTAYLGGLAKFMLALLVVFFVCNEFTYRTSRQNVIDGLHRNEFMLSKQLGILVLSLFTTMLIGIATLALGLSKGAANDMDVIIMGSPFLLAYFLEVLGYLTVAFFFSVVFKRTGVAIILLLLYSVVVEPLLYYKLPPPIEDYLPLQSINGLIEFPFKRYFAGLIELEVQNSVDPIKAMFSVLWTGVFFLGALIIFKKRDL
jgi:ABC-2 type transport system permease protein